MLVRNTSADSRSLCRTAIPCFVPDVEREGSLAPVGQGQRQVDAVAFGTDPLGGQTSVGVTLDGLDVHDLGTPVGQECSGHRHEDPLGHLDDTDTIEGLLSHARSCSPGR